MNTLIENQSQTISTATISYSGNLINSNTLYVEYSYFPFNSVNTVYNKLEMNKIENTYSVSIPIEKARTIYFRFINDNNQISTSEDKQGFQMIVKESSSKNITTKEAEVISDQITNSLAMIPLKERNLNYAKKGLRFSYKLNNRIKLLLYKLLTRLPNFITGNYRRRINL